ncbi:MAG TPA: FGGY family carbohydrate kinase [Flavihumibacter sp.]|nr:FGGY family carbohydrate kinase [Flavihumibacter sp.]HPZ86755.1 FGGY family carbohydrate kinase [Flavihumibacter sp.]HQD08049.1 FGGY family carbohydrate kinase [Flavihumibacter sp.]
MSAVPVIAIFDVGKTNKKLILFDESYNIIEEHHARFNETLDEEGFPCENLKNFRVSIIERLEQFAKRTDIDIKAVNFSAYGASFVYLDEDAAPLSAMYNYLKPYPAKLADQLYQQYGGATAFARQTASPSMGSLNAGLQLWRLMKERPSLYDRMEVALHLPQYVSSLVTRKAFTDCTSVGCHTALWDFEKNNYHAWVTEKGLNYKFAPIKLTDTTVEVKIAGKKMLAGIGMHDSSAALIPYLKGIEGPFALLSTGTWGISLNPFNTSPLTDEELANDCLFFLGYDGRPVKAARYFAGRELEKKVAAISEKYGIHAALLHEMPYQPDGTGNGESYVNDYHRMMEDIVEKQVQSLKLVLTPTIKRLYVDGGFSKNEVFLGLLCRHLPTMQVYAATTAQASALGAAMVLHDKWNSQPLNPAQFLSTSLYSKKG